MLRVLVPRHVHLVQQVRHMCCSFFIKYYLWCIGTYSTSGAIGCTNCASGTYSSTGASSCASCSVGMYHSIISQVKLFIIKGTYSSSGASSCLSCSAGILSFSI